MRSGRGHLTTLTGGGLRCGNSCLGERRTAGPLRLRSGQALGFARDGNLTVVLSGKVGCRLGPVGLAFVFPLQVGCPTQAPLLGLNGSNKSQTFHLSIPHPYPKSVTFSNLKRLKAHFCTYSPRNFARHDDPRVWPFQ